MSNSSNNNYRLKSTLQCKANECSSQAGRLHGLPESSYDARAIRELPGYGSDRE